MIYKNLPRVLWTLLAISVLALLIIAFSAVAQAQESLKPPVITSVINIKDVGNKITFNAEPGATGYSVYKNMFYVDYYEPDNASASHTYTDPSGSAVDNYYLVTVKKTDGAVMYSPRPDKAYYARLAEPAPELAETKAPERANPILALTQALKVGLLLKPGDVICIKSLYATVNGVRMIPPLNFCFPMDVGMELETE